MNRILSVILFFGVFFLIYFFGNFYVFSRLASLLGIKKELVFYTILVVMTISFPLATIIEKQYANPVTRVFYTISATYLGMLLFAFVLLLIYEITEYFVAVPKFYAGLAIICIVVILSTVAVFSTMPRIKKVEIPIGKEMTIVQLSDLHIGTVHEPAFLDKIIDKTNSLNPDIVAITGDLFDGTAPIEPGMFDSLNKIKAPILFVTGNHETYEGIDKVYSVLNTTKVKILRNEMIEINGVQFIGVDYSNRLERTLSKIEYSQTKPTILLYHVPSETLDYLNSQNITLQLAGHTHDGQIFPINFISRLIYPYINGLHQKNGTYIYVSPGTGTWGPPMRLGSRSEITLIEAK